MSETEGPIEIRYAPTGIRRELIFAGPLLLLWPLFGFLNGYHWLFYIAIGAIYLLVGSASLSRYRALEERPLFLSIDDDGLTIGDSAPRRLEWDDILSVEIERGRLSPNVLAIALSESARKRFWNERRTVATEYELNNLEVTPDEVLEAIESKLEPHRLARIRTAKAELESGE